VSAGDGARILNSIIRLLLGRLLLLLLPDELSCHSHIYMFVHYCTSVYHQPPTCSLAHLLTRSSTRTRLARALRSWTKPNFWRYRSALSTTSLLTRLCSFQLTPAAPNQSGAIQSSHSLDEMLRVVGRHSGHGAVLVARSHFHHSVLRQQVPPHLLTH
jgi:hypothetical protein